MRSLKIICNKEIEMEIKTNATKRNRAEIL